MCYLLCNYPPRSVRLVLKSLIKAQAHILANGVLHLQSATREPFKLWHCVLMLSCLFFLSPTLSTPECVLQLCSVPLSSVMETIIALIMLGFQCRTALSLSLDDADLKRWGTNFKRVHIMNNITFLQSIKDHLLQLYVAENLAPTPLDCWCKFINIQHD